MAGALRAVHLEVPRAYTPIIFQKIAEPLLYSELSLPADDIGPLFRHLLAKDLLGMQLGLWTKHLLIMVHGDSDIDLLPSLLLCMPNLRSFTLSLWSKKAIIPTLWALRQRASSALCDLAIHINTEDTRNTIALVGQFSSLSSLSLQFSSALEADMISLCEPLRMHHLVHLTLELPLATISGFSRWLSLCLFQKLVHLTFRNFIDGLEHSQTNALFSLSPFFANHRFLRKFTVDVHSRTAQTVLLRLPASVDEIVLINTRLPREFVPLPPSLKRLRITIDPNRGDIFTFFNRLLAATALPMTEIHLSFSDDFPSYGDFTRFTWKTWVMPTSNIYDLGDAEIETRGKLLLYALQFRQREIAVMDEDACVWPVRDDPGA
jgi:hypothetical protein